MARATLAGVAMATVVMASTGCSSVRSVDAQASSAAVRFHVALAGGDMTTACDLLAPKTREELEQTSGTSCAKALADDGLPRANAVMSRDVYGSNARVVLDGDTLFMARFGEQWKVTAAGCEPRPSRPYQCEVKGG